MCSIAAAGGIMAAGTVVNTYSAYQQQKAANAQARFQAKLADANAAEAEYEAEQAIKRGQLEASAHLSKVNALVGAQRVGFAGSGVSVLSGSPAAAVRETQILGNNDALMIRYNAELEAWRMRREGRNASAQAALYRSSTSSPLMAAGTTLLGGASRLAMLFGMANAGAGGAAGAKSYQPSYIDAGGWHQA